MSHPTFPISHILFLFFKIKALRAAAGSGRDALRRKGREASDGEGGSDGDGGGSDGDGAGSELEKYVYRWALIYLPLLFPQLRRVVWIQTDVLVRADLLRLWKLPLKVPHPPPNHPSFTTPNTPRLPPNPCTPPYTHTLHPPTHTPPLHPLPLWCPTQPPDPDLAHYTLLYIPRPVAPTYIPL